MIAYEEELNELRAKIEDIETFSQEQGFDLSQELQQLYNREKELREKLYSNLSPWERVQLARLKERPGTMDFLEEIFTDFIELHGDRLYGDDLSIVGGIARLAGKPLTIVGHRRGRNTKENIKYNFGMPHPEGYRKARRLMEQAAKFRRPIITFIDTPGAYCGSGAEERGQGEAIARNLMVMSRLPVPIVSVLIGEGGSGGALALGVADRFLMLENAVFSVISPEGCASILFKDASQAPEAAKALKLTATELNDFGLIDEVISEPLGGAHHNRGEIMATIRTKLLESVEQLSQLSPAELLAARWEKYRNIGVWS